MPTTDVDVKDQIFTVRITMLGISYKVAETVVTPPPVVGTLTLTGRSPTGPRPTVSP